jgi:hypothetical protein
MLFRTIGALVLATGWTGQALAWGQERHSMIVELAQHRLTPEAAAEVGRLLGQGRSLASVSSWADDVHDQRPETYNWHFVDIPLAEGPLQSGEGLPALREGRLHRGSA